MVQALERENVELKAKITALQKKAIRDNDAANVRLTLIIQSLSHPPPSSKPVKKIPCVFLSVAYLCVVGLSVCLILMYKCYYGMLVNLFLCCSDYSLLILFSITIDIPGLLHIFFMMPKGGSKIGVAK